MKFRKKPVVIEAIQFNGNKFEVIEWAIKHNGAQEIEPREDGVWIRTLEGVMHASPGDWIIRGINGEFYPCKPDIFDRTYEPVIDAKMF